MTWDSTAFPLAPGVLGDGVSSALSNALDLIGAGDVTTYVIFKLRGWGGGTQGALVNNGKVYIYVENDGKVKFSSDGWTTVAVSAASIALATRYVVAVTRTAAGLTTFWINGVLSGAPNQSSGTPAAGGATYIGNRAAGDRAFDGWMSALLVYSGIHTPAEIARRTGELRARYQI
jgi:hypothetical protein